MDFSAINKDPPHIVKGFDAKQLQGTWYKVRRLVLLFFGVVLDLVLVVPVPFLESLPLFSSLLLICLLLLFFLLCSVLFLFLFVLLFVCCCASFFILFAFLMVYLSWWCASPLLLDKR